MKILFGKTGNFYKANLHCHSTNSDGKLSVEELKEAYKSRGYSVVAFTDHEHLLDNSHLNDDSFLAITSCEIAIKAEPEKSTLVKTDMQVVHLNFYAKEQGNTLTPCYNSVYDHFLNDRIRGRVRFSGEYDRVYSKEGINAIISEAKKRGFLVSYNHPTWSLEDSRHFLEYEGLFAVEIYNHSCFIQGLPSDEVAVDKFRRAGKRVFLTACDDNHNLTPIGEIRSDSFGGFVMIDAEELSYSAIMAALERGDFYASQGPEIYSIVREGDTVKVSCSSAERISLIRETRAAETAFAEQGGSINGAVFSLDAKNGGFRIRVTDCRGKSAFSQYYDL